MSLCIILFCRVPMGFIEMSSWVLSIIVITSSNGHIFRVTGPRAGNSPSLVNSPHKRPMTMSFDVLFDLRPNKRLNEQSWAWWFDTPSRSLWHHCNVFSIISFSLFPVWCPLKWFCEFQMLIFLYIFCSYIHSTYIEVMTLLDRNNYILVGQK